VSRLERTRPSTKAARPRAPAICHFVTFNDEEIVAHCDRPGRPWVIRDLGEHLLCDEHRELLERHAAMVDFLGEWWIGLRGPTGLDDVLPGLP
jgi:hypothetical protein